MICVDLQSSELQKSRPKPIQLQRTPSLTDAIYETAIHGAVQ